MNNHYLHLFLMKKLMDEFLKNKIDLYDFLELIFRVKFENINEKLLKEYINLGIEIESQSENNT